VYRGRLIQRFVAVLYRIDTAATAAVVGGGYDPEFGEPLPVANGSLLGASSLRERPALRLPCQLDRKTWGAAGAARSGYEENADIILVFHYPDLEAAGLIGTDGVPQIFPGDRIGAIEDVGGAVQETFANPPGMFVTDLERAGHGLAAFGMPRFNLLIAYCSKRHQAMTGGGA
jgi:hypothetical protein